MVLDHLPKLLGLYAQLIDVVFERLKLFINQVHHILLRLCGIGQLLVVRVFAHIDFVGKTERLYVAGHPQDRFSLDSLDCLPLMSLLKSVVEMHLEL